jgi:predicted nucleotidyltransferase
LLKPDVSFDDLLARSEEVALNNTTVRIASVEDLIVLKRHAGRPQDLADIEQLEAIRRRKGSL